MPISATNSRIEAFHRGGGNGGLPAPAADPQLAAFSFATNRAGQIIWAEPPILIGAFLPELADGVEDRLRQRLPIAALPARLEETSASPGLWQIDAGPDFDGAGHFIGYSGRLRRPAPLPPPEEAESEADRIRQILHELRTPANAIQGFAELIQQQLYGPAPHEYRAHAAAIAADTAHMLAGFDELERWALLDGGALTLEPGTCDFAALTGELAARVSPRAPGLTLAVEPGAMPVPLEAQDAERLLWRVLGLLTAAPPARNDATPRQPCRLELRRQAGFIVLSAHLPSTYPDSAPRNGLFGSAFTLRLAATEARAAGGSLTQEGTALRLVLPAAELPTPEA